mmetsp:Transcript_67152/g.99435  ORF Transcript_67152/g.99435 Transcript_67152/m.99435 type:complete len:83 (+) Transcript_67152:262-510(+)
MQLRKLVGAYHSARIYLQKQHASGKGEEKSSYTPTSEELSSMMGLKISEMLSVQRRMTHTRNVLSLDYQYASTTRSGGGNLV